MLDTIIARIVAVKPFMEFLGDGSSSTSVVFIVSGKDIPLLTVMILEVGKAIVFMFFRTAVPL